VPWCREQPTKQKTARARQRYEVCSACTSSQTGDVSLHAPILGWAYQAGMTPQARELMSRLGGLRHGRSPTSPARHQRRRSDRCGRPAPCPLWLWRKPVKLVPDRLSRRGIGPVRSSQITAPGQSRSSARSSVGIRSHLRPRPRSGSYRYSRRDRGWRRQPAGPVGCRRSTASGAVYNLGEPAKMFDACAPA